ncbi:MAG: hypothetical protein EOP09_14165, partial [Proteobacteria bacterium]
MSLHVLLHHPVQIPALKYGGIERVVLWLAQGLIEAGHRVSIVCEGDGDLPAGIHRVKPAYFNELNQVPGRVRETLQVDLIHFHATPSESEWEPTKLPYLVTIHGNGKLGEKYLPHTVFVSRDHAQRHGRSAFVHNGVNPTDYDSSPQKDRSFRFLSKTSWEVKNLRGALEICDAAGVTLEIAGGNRPVGLRMRVAFSSHRWWGAV